ncbi:MAG: hypothetical protein GY854_19695 [Deltaproteobacteria bacterium]|nr:hypothetical protein [Deltaproteobacteria bacterium]
MSYQSAMRELDEMIEHNIIEGDYVNAKIARDLKARLEAKHEKKQAAQGPERICDVLKRAMQ